MPNITVCISVDWEGRGLTGIDALKSFNERFPNIPLTHFVSAAYLSRTSEEEVLEKIAQAMVPAVKPADEIALHIHCWRSLYEDYRGGKEYTTKPRGTETLVYADQVYKDSGYVVALSSLEPADINQLFDVSIQKIQPFLAALGTANKVQYPIQGFRSGGWMANDKVFGVLQMGKGLVYDASAVDCLFGLRASEEYVEQVEPMAEGIAKMWGAAKTANNTQNWQATLGSGVGRMTGPYRVGNLIELPNNGMLLPAVDAADVQNFLGWALSQPANRDLYLSIGFHQESSPRYIKDFGDVIEPYSQNPQIQWLTHVAYAQALGALPAA
ncbi:MAG: hypothetical protein ACREVL_18520 [Solimonas sp.]